MVLLCITIDGRLILAGIFGNCLIPRSPVKTSKAVTPRVALQGPATKMQEIFYKKNNKDSIKSHPLHIRSRVKSYQKSFLKVSHYQ